jgi:hypothetical protein
MLYVFFMAIKQRGFLAGLVSLKGKEGGKKVGKTFGASAYIDLNCKCFHRFFFSPSCSSQKQAGKLKIFDITRKM